MDASAIASATPRKKTDTIPRAEYRILAKSPQSNHKLTAKS